MTDWNRNEKKKKLVKIFIRGIYSNVVGSGVRVVMRMDKYVIGSVGEFYKSDLSGVISFCRVCHIVQTKYQDNPISAIHTMSSSYDVDVINEGSRTEKLAVN